MSKALMIQGTGSHVGKSLLVAGLCRVFRNSGTNVAPFKSQNMALNSFVTEDGKEIGRAQVMQAAACKLEPDINMNPILLKPNGNGSSQVMLEGKFYGNITYADYYEKRPFLWDVVVESFYNLKKNHDLIIIEGAGSPAETNLMDKEIVNMATARLADAAVILVGDIDRGGVFASFVGTLELLPLDDRARIKGFIINKFRGDKALLKEAVDDLEKRTGIPVLGIVDLIADLQLDAEDSVSLESYKLARQENLPEGVVDIAIIKLPLISNYTDFEPLINEPDVYVRYVSNVNELGRPDLIIIPGSKNVISDLKFLRERGLADAITGYAEDGGFVFGICGGYQMLGISVADPSGIESEAGTTCQGLSLLETETELTGDKQLRKVTANLSEGGSRLFAECDQPISGYEIHVGKTTVFLGNHLFEVINSQPAKRYFDGAISDILNVAGCYIHGLFDEPRFRRSFINKTRADKGLEPLRSQGKKRSEIIDSELDRLASILEKQLNIEDIVKIINGDEIISLPVPQIEAKC